MLAHLKGQHVMGIYPLLPDETCWLLAVDFDESAWADDVRAFVRTCRRLGVPVAVGVSRSGTPRPQLRTRQREAADEYARPLPR